MHDIFHLIKNNQINEFKKFVKEDREVLKSKDTYDHTPFYYAVTCGKYDFVEYLLQQGEDPNVPGPKDGLAALSYYVFANNAQPMTELVPMLDLLLKYNANINLRSRTGETLLTLVSSLSDEKFVQYVLDNGAAVGLPDNMGDTALHHAARWSKSEEVIKCLVKAHSNVNAINWNGKTPLMNAVDGRFKLGIVRVLLENNADTQAKSKNGDTALHFAMKTCTQITIQKKPTDDQPLMYPPDPLAVQEETVVATLKLLRDHGADFDQENNEQLAPRDVLEHISNKGVKEFVSSIPSKRTGYSINRLLGCFGFWSTLPIQIPSLNSCIPTDRFTM